MLQYHCCFLHFNQHARIHPNSCILIHISLVLLLSSGLHPCLSQDWGTLLGFGHTARLITLCTFWTNRATFPQTSPTSSVASSSNTSKSVPRSLTDPVQEQFLNGWRSKCTHEDREETWGGGRKKEKIKGRVRGKNKKKSGVSKSGVPIRKRERPL